MADFEAAKDKVLMGAERRSMVMTEHEKELTAYHEAGHALVGLAVPGNDPLHKVTIIPRGRGLGVTMNLPERDRYAFRKNEIEARLAMMFGGRVAEQLVFGMDNVTTGAANDIQQATDMARRMVTEWGMSEALGRLRYSDNEEEIFLGRSITRTRNVSEDTARLIDGEVRRIVESAEAKANAVLSERLDDLHALARALLESKRYPARRRCGFCAVRPLTAAIIRPTPKTSRKAAADRCPPAEPAAGATAPWWHAGLAAPGISGRGGGLSRGTLPLKRFVYPAPSSRQRASVHHYSTLKRCSARTLPVAASMAERRQLPRMSLVIAMPE